MRYEKGDYIDDYKILLMLKSNKDADIETYRVMSGSGQLCVLKHGITEAERNAAVLSKLFVGLGDDYAVYKHVSGETLEARLTREICSPVDEMKSLVAQVLVQLIALHEAGFAHCSLTADNIMIDLAGIAPQAWIIGFSSVAKADKDSISTDLKAVGTLIYRMVFGLQPETPLRLPNKQVTGLDDTLLNIIYQALSDGFGSAQEMLDCFEGRKAASMARKPIGIGFAAVAGMDEVKRQLQNDVIDILADREGAQAYGINIPNGMLLYGPPGCGKTFIAERFAEQAGYNYRYVKSSDLGSTYIHGSQEKIAALFDEARRTSPTIICFDEFDALVPRRDEKHSAYVSAEVNEFLTQLNNCGRDGVFVIATTNRLDIIDPAVLRTGRIDYVVHVPLPDKSARKEMFELALKGKPISEEIDCQHLSNCTEGYRASDIAAIVADAARKAFRAKCLIDMPLLKDAIANCEQRRKSLEGQGSDKHGKIGFK